MSLEDFENEYWRKHNQGIVFRHRAALNFIKKGPVLDLGCGDGLFLEMLKEKGITGQGLEVSEVAVEKARARGLDVQKFDFSDSKLPLNDNSFEAVVLLDVLEHMYQPEKILKEAHRVTKENLVLAVPNFNSLPARLQMLMGKVPENNTLWLGHVYWTSYSIIRGLLQRNKFRMVDLRVNSFFSTAPILKNLMQFLAKLRPSVFALIFVIKAKKLS